nr:hypothetical protein [Tanacetum cinerariifolium]
MEEDVTAIKEVNAAEPTVFDDKEVTMTMAHTLIKMKAEKQRILDEQIAKRLQDEEIEQAAARERHEKEDLGRAKVLQQQYDQKKLEKKRRTKHSGLKRLQKVGTSQRVKSQTDTIVDAREDASKQEGKITELDADEDVTLVDMDTTLRAKVKVSGSSSTQQEETTTVDPTKISKEDVQNMLQIVPMAEFKVEALQVKYPLIDWEIYSEGSRTY